jgi:VIT1/CCC1 family predicted Fe2+/Mn2+ transporter
MVSVTDDSGAATREQAIHKRVLDPAERIAEVLFGLIMVLTFTGSLGVADAGREDIRAMLIGALGCNIAWGLIDGVLYLMGCLAERGRDLANYRAIVQAPDAQQAHRLIANLLPPALGSVLQPQELERMRQRLLGLHLPPQARLTGSDWQGALGVFLLVFLSTFPVAVPFMLFQNATMALRASNAVAIAMLFAAGVAYGRIVGHTPWMIGISMVALGSVLVALTIALGG